MCWTHAEVTRVQFSLTFVCDSIFVWTNLIQNCTVIPLPPGSYCPAVRQLLPCRQAVSWFQSSCIMLWKYRSCKSVGFEDPLKKYFLKVFLLWKFWCWSISLVHNFPVNLNIGVYCNLGHRKNSRNTIVLVSLIVNFLPYCMQTEQIIRQFAKAVC